MKDTTARDEIVAGYYALHSALETMAMNDLRFATQLQRTLKPPVYVIGDQGNDELAAAVDDLSKLVRSEFEPTIKLSGDEFLGKNSWESSAALILGNSINREEEVIQKLADLDDPALRIHTTSELETFVSDYYHQVNIPVVPGNPIEVAIAGSRAFRSEIWNAIKKRSVKGTPFKLNPNYSITQLIKHPERFESEILLIYTPEDYSRQAEALLKRALPQLKKTVPYASVLMGMTRAHHSDFLQDEGNTARLQEFLGRHARTEIYPGIKVEPWRFDKKGEGIHDPDIFIETQFMRLAEAALREREKYTKHIYDMRGQSPTEFIDHYPSIITLRGTSGSGKTSITLKLSGLEIGDLPGMHYVAYITTRGQRSGKPGEEDALSGTRQLSREQFKALLENRDIPFSLIYKDHEYGWLRANNHQFPELDDEGEIRILGVNDILRENKIPIINWPSPKLRRLFAEEYRLPVLDFHLFEPTAELVKAIKWRENEDGTPSSQSRLHQIGPDFQKFYDGHYHGESPIELLVYNADIERISKAPPESYVGEGMLAAQEIVNIVRCWQEMTRKERNPVALNEFHTKRRDATLERSMSVVNDPALIEAREYSPPRITSMADLETALEGGERVYLNFKENVLATHPDIASDRTLLQETRVEVLHVDGARPEAHIVYLQMPNLEVTRTAIQS